MEQIIPLTPFERGNPIMRTRTSVGIFFMSSSCLIYLLAVIGMFLLTSVSVHAFDMRSNRQVSTETRGECDSIYLSNSKAYAVKNLVLMEKEVSFQFCEDQENQTQTVPWRQLKYIKKADGTILTAPTSAQIAADRKASKKHALHPFSKRNQGIVLLVFGVLGTLLFWVGLFFIAYTSHSFLLFILAAILGYTALVYLFKTAFVKLMPHKRKRTRNMLAAFSPLLVPVILNVIVGIIAGIISLLS